MLFWATCLVMVFTLIGFASCIPEQELNSGERLENAARTSTALIDDARATLMIIEAQRIATSIVENSFGPVSEQPPEFAYTSQAPTPISAISNLPTPSGVEIVDVTLNAGGTFIIIQFKAPPRVAETWGYEDVYLVDEALNGVYRNIPRNGSADLYFARPKENGQVGYVMLVNSPYPLKVGDLVTVFLDGYQQQHLRIK
jgi:hypothetical protein